MSMAQEIVWWLRNRLPWEPLPKRQIAQQMLCELQAKYGEPIALASCCVNLALLHSFEHRVNGQTCWR